MSELSEWQMRMQVSHLSKAIILILDLSHDSSRLQNDSFTSRSQKCNWGDHDQILTPACW